MNKKQELINGFIRDFFCITKSMASSAECFDLKPDTEQEEIEDALKKLIEGIVKGAPIKGSNLDYVSTSYKFDLGYDTKTDEIKAWQRGYIENE